jgi:uncharacterized protein YndB with AHSA1/START domain
MGSANPQHALHRSWPPAADEQPAMQVHTEVEVRVPPAQLFAYVTDPSRWHEWHPATAAVGVPHAGPMSPGESWTEDIRVAARSGRCSWTVLASEPGALWVIGGIADGGQARITYRFTPTPQGTRFHRTLEFRSASALWRLLDGNLLKWALARQSRRALDNLKRRVEGG